MVSLNFDASQVEPSTDFEPVPAGKYLAVIAASELKPNRSQTGSYLELEFVIIEGEQKGRKLWSRLNLNNPSEVAEKIAHAELSAICRAAGVMRIGDSHELHDIPLVIKVKVRRRVDTDEPTNEIVAYKSREGKPIQATTDAPPWSRR